MDVRRAPFDLSRRDALHHTALGIGPNKETR